MLTREHVRMARAALQWSVRKLAEQAGVTANTVSRFENGADAKGETLRKIQRAFEQAGIEFISERDGSLGVRLMKQEHARKF